MLAKRIIPCLDIANGRVVKGVKFVDLVDAGAPAELAVRYEQEGADELVLLDITATVENRGTFVELVARVAKAIRIPFTVGGGVRTVEDVRALLTAGADKVSFGTAAVVDPEVVRQASEEFGKQAIVISVDAKLVESREVSPVIRQGSDERYWTVWTQGGREDSGVDVLNFCRQMEELGAGELLVNSLDRDGTRKGFDLELLKAVTDSVSIPVIASSGAGKVEDFFEAIEMGRCDAVLAAGVFHRGEMTVAEVKEYLSGKGICIRSVGNVESVGIVVDSKRVKCTRGAFLISKDLKALKNPDFDKMEGLIPAVAQDRSTGDVLMVGFMNEEAYRRTISERRVWFWSRTKKRLWMKGEESGNVLTVMDVRLDCDLDTVLVMVEASGPTCHTGEVSCFGKCGRPGRVRIVKSIGRVGNMTSQYSQNSQKSQSSSGFLFELFDLLKLRRDSGDSTSYTRRLLDGGVDKVCAKVMEEAEEVCRAAKSETDERVAEEAADVLYHLMVLLMSRGVGLEEVVEVLQRRHKH